MKLDWDKRNSISRTPFRYGMRCFITRSPVTWQIGRAKKCCASTSSLILSAGTFRFGKTTKLSCLYHPIWLFNWVAARPTIEHGLCTEILRQLRLDTVIIRAKADVKESSDKWLMGVVIERQVYLYDLRLGLPVRNSDGETTATLAQIVDHPEWLTQMSANETYRLTVVDLREPSVSGVANPNVWCRRMHNLEQVLPAASVCVLYDPVVNEDGRSGTLQRIATNGNFSIDSLKRWQYPRQQAAASTSSDRKNRSRKMRRSGHAVQRPVSRSPWKDGKPVVGSRKASCNGIEPTNCWGSFPKRQSDI